MSFQVRRSAVLVFGLVLLAQFNNCSSTGTTQGQLNAQDLTSVCPTLSGNTQTNSSNSTIDPTTGQSSADCTLQSAALLSVTPLPGGSMAIPHNISEFNVAGDCNEGAFPSNKIRWELTYNNTVVRSSFMALANGQNMDSACVNGKFRLYVYLGPISEDNVNRTGLLLYSGGIATGYGNYTLNIQIIGYDQNGQAYKNSLAGFQTLYLVPLN